MGFVNGETISEDDYINESEADATPANDAGKAVKLESDGKMSDFFLNTQFRELLSTYETIDGATTPKPVVVLPDGTVATSDANNNDFDDFFGFVTEAITATPGAFLNKTNGAGATTFSHTVNAGTDRYVVVAWTGAENGTTPTVPTGVTWDGNAMTEIISIAGTNSAVSFWGYPAGSNGSSDTGDVVITGASAGEIARTYALNYEYIDQSTPVADTYSTDVLSASGTSGEQHTDTNGIAVIGVASRVSTADGDGIDRYNGTAGTLADYIGDELSYKGEEGIAWTTTGGPSQTSIASFALNNSVTVDCRVKFGGIIGGFSGLTPGSIYYVQNTRGTIGTSPGSTSIQVGRAISATQILIMH